MKTLNGCDSSSIGCLTLLYSSYQIKMMMERKEGRILHNLGMQFKASGGVGWNPTNVKILSHWGNCWELLRLNR
jgi:hypothetical protein